MNQKLAKWADTPDAVQAIHDAIQRFYFVDSINSSDIDALVEITFSPELDSNAACQVLKKRTLCEAIDAGWARAGLLETRCVPTFLQRNSVCY
ncbi:MAG: hypothetical protein CMD92_02320 [Gammaproteobacteria bacterium]|nr:hypothetical protein [Gammaproteobacteria bacterium]HBW83801.1 hypothetical protein [Gammaproteobacteria bacterium]